MNYKNLKQRIKDSKASYTEFKEFLWDFLQDNKDGGSDWFDELEVSYYPEDKEGTIDVEFKGETYFFMSTPATGTPYPREKFNSDVDENIGSIKGLKNYVKDIKKEVSDSKKEPKKELHKLNKFITQTYKFYEGSGTWKSFLAKFPDYTEKEIEKAYSIVTNPNPNTKVKDSVDEMDMTLEWEPIQDLEYDAEDGYEEGYYYDFEIGEDEWQAIIPTYMGEEFPCIIQEKGTDNIFKFTPVGLATFEDIIMEFEDSGDISYLENYKNS